MLLGFQQLVLLEALVDSNNLLAFVNGDGSLGLSGLGELFQVSNQGLVLDSLGFLSRIQLSNSFLKDCELRF